MRDSSRMTDPNPSSMIRRRPATPRSRSFSSTTPGPVDRPGVSIKRRIVRSYISSETCTTLADTLVVGALRPLIAVCRVSSASRMGGTSGPTDFGLVCSESIMSCMKLSLMGALALHGNPQRH